MAKKTWGGKRKGAGRKPSAEGRTVLVTASVPEPLVTELDYLAESEGWNRSQAVTEAIRGLLRRKKRRS
jgi:hypothetical protein